MFNKLALSYNQKFTEFSLYPSILDRSAWDNLDSTLCCDIIKSASPYIHYSYPTLSASKFMEFSTLGNRSEYEASYFARRIALNSLVLAECIDNSGTYMTDIVNGIFLICEESGWQLPAHNSYARNTPSHLLPDSTKPVLDLFACETGALLSTIDYLIGSKLDSISPLIRRRISHELHFRILTPYLNEHFWWMGHGQEKMNNWTIWCTQNILLTFFLTPLASNLRKTAFLKATKSVDYFLNEYGEDGCCDEGAQYYRHAGLCLFNTIEILNHITNDLYLHVYSSAKIGNIAAYIYNVHVSGDYYINFSDCASKPGPSGTREFLFAKRVGNLDMMNYVVKDFQSSAKHPWANEINLYYKLQHVFTYNELTNTSSAETYNKKDIYYESVGLSITRDDQFCLGIKAGDNDDSHNHNDTGSFTLYKNGRPVFIDIGVESYNFKTFSDKRYEIWTMQSDFHNLPTINREMQCDGPNYYATNVIVNNENHVFTFMMNLTHAYPSTTGLNQYTRKITFNKNRNIEIIDSMSFKDSKNHNLISNLITYEKPLLKDNRLYIGDICTVLLKADIDHIDIETLDITDPRLKLSWDHELYRTQIHYKGEDFIMNII